MDGIFPAPKAAAGAGKTRSRIHATSRNDPKGGVGRGMLLVAGAGVGVTVTVTVTPINTQVNDDLDREGVRLDKLFYLRKSSDKRSRYQSMEGERV
jgi:hypothetical protein